MTKEASKEFFRMFDLIEKGKLSGCVIPRMFYSGHEVVHCIYSSTRKYKCIRCEAESTSTSDNPLKFCPECSAEAKFFGGEFFDVTDDAQARWRCRKCQHEWDGKDGKTCPSCGDVKK